MQHRRVAFIIVLVAITMGACSPDQKQQIAACELEADRFFLSRRAANTDDPRSQFIIACMASKGYDFTVTPDECSGQRPLATQTACYTPTSWLFWITSRFHRQ